MDVGTRRIPEECWECSVMPKPHFVMRSLKGRLVEPCSWIAPVAMNPVVWSKLPEELLERCVAMLPVGNRQRFVVVAKRWKSLLCSPEFQLLCDDVGPRSSAPICSLEYHQGPVPPPLSWNTCCRLHIGVSFRTTKISEVHRLEFGKGFPDKFKRTAQGWQDKGAWRILQNGLVFMFQHQAGMRATDLCVVNPMTQQWLELPPHFDATEYYHFVHSRAQVKSLPAGQFELLIVSGRPRTLSIYSSQDARWSRVILEGAAKGQQGKICWPSFLLGTRWQWHAYCLFGLNMFPSRACCSWLWAPRAVLIRLGCECTTRMMGDL